MAKGGKGRKGGGGGGGGKTRKYARDNKGRFASTGSGGATARGGRLKTAAGNKRKTQTIEAAGQKGVLAKPKGLKPGAIKAKAAASNRKAQLAAGAQRRNAQADRIDAKVKTLESQYRSKDAAFYTQGVKPAARDRMIAKSQQAAQLREQSAALRTKAANAERMSKQTKGTAASKKQERRNAFDAAGYKVGDTVTTSQYGTQKITKISKNSVSFDKGNSQDKAFMANYLKLEAKPAGAKPAAAPKAPKPAKTTAKSKPVKATEKQRNIRQFMDQKGGIVARDYKRDAQAFRQPLAKKDQKPGGPKTVGGALEALTSKSFKRAASKLALTQSESTQAQKLISDNNIKGYKVVRGERGDLLQRVSGISGKSASLGESAALRKASRKPAARSKR